MSGFYIEEISAAVKQSLTDDLRQPKYRDKPVPAGCCYVASEAIYHLMSLVGNRDERNTLTVYRMNHEGVSHWFLYDEWKDSVLDITAEQFEKQPMYIIAKRAAFLTHLPSKRAQVVIARATKILEQSRMTVDKK